MLESIEEAMLSEYRVSRPRAVHCTCPMPECEVAHDLHARVRESAIADRKAAKLASHEWMAELNGQVAECETPDFWRPLIDGDDIEFCRRLRAALARIAEDEAKDELQ